MTVHFTSQFKTIPLKSLDDNNEHDHLGEDPDEKCVPSNLENLCKQKNELPFPLTAQTALYIGIIVCCMECCKSRLIYRLFNQMKLKNWNVLYMVFTTFVARHFKKLLLLITIHLPFSEKFFLKKTSPVRVI